MFVMPPNSMGEMAEYAFAERMISASERKAILYGNMLITFNQYGEGEIFNLNHRDTPVPLHEPCRIYEGRADDILKDRLLGL